MKVEKKVWKYCYSYTLLCRILECKAHLRQQEPLAQICRVSPRRLGQIEVRSRHTIELTPVLFLTGPSPPLQTASVCFFGRLPSVITEPVSNWTGQKMQMWKLSLPLQPFSGLMYELASMGDWRLAFSW